MGSNFHVNIGPYVECSFEPKQIISVFKGCSNSSCSNNGLELKSPFCPLCGQGQSDISRTVMCSVSQGRVIDALKDVLISLSSIHKENTHVYTINSLRQGINTYSLVDYEEDNLKDLSDINPKKEINDFKQAYIKELEILSSFYKIVTIKWGVVNYRY